MEFKEWRQTFQAFKDDCDKILSKDVPSESSELHFESQHLEALLYDSGEFASKAIGFYYARKQLEIKKLVFLDWPKSSLDGSAKAASYEELETRESAERLQKTIVSRIFAVKEALRTLEPK